jgi:NAD(P)H dehydrogenase (quinone)
MTDWMIDESIATPNLIRALELEGRVETVLRCIALPPGLTRVSVPSEVLATRASALLTLVAKPLLDASRLPVCSVNASCWIGFNISWFYAHDIRAFGQIRMPAHEYRVAGGQQYTYAAQAALIGQVLGKEVRWVDDDSSLRRIMGGKFGKLLTYQLHDTDAYRCVPETRDLELLLARERTSLRQYVGSIRGSLAWGTFFC